MTLEVKGILLKHLNLYLHEDRQLDSFDESRLLDSLGLDSLDVLELIFDLEEHFAVTVDANHLDTMKTLGDLLTAFENRQHNTGYPS
ncbi:MAG: acyl carrier protein [Gammaproteobacteria bacterium]